MFLKIATLALCDLNLKENIKKKNTSPIIDFEAVGYLKTKMALVSIIYLKEKKCWQMIAKNKLIILF